MFNLHISFYPSGTSRGLIASDGKEYDSEIEKKRLAQPSCIMFNMTHRSKHCRLYDIIQKGAKPFLCDVEYNSERQIFCDVQYDSKRQTLPSCVKLRLIQGQTLSYCTMTLVMAQRGKLCHLAWCAESETERQTLSSSVMLNTHCSEMWIRRNFSVLERDWYVL